MVFDRREQITLLNRDLYGEHDAILHYLTHAWSVVRQYGPEIIDIAEDEMRHLKWLAHTIIALGGVPDLTSPPVEPQPDIEHAIRRDIQAERYAIDQYQLHQEEIADDRVKGLLGRITVDEKDHLRRFLEMLDNTQGEPWADRGSESDVPEVADQLRQLVSVEYQQVLSYLFQSFFKDHGHQMGMNFEERAIEEMRHLGWMAECLGSLNGTSFFSVTQTPQPREFDETALYQKVRVWAVEAMPSLVPTIDRILAHEAYQSRIQDRGFTVGPLTREG